MKTDHRSGRAYTQVELDFIKAHADLRPRQLAELFNSTFDRYAEPKRMSMWLRKMGVEPNIRQTHKYTDEQREWLAANASTMSERELAAAFNDLYGANVSVDALRGYVKTFIRVKRTKDAASKHRSLGQRKLDNGDTTVHSRGGRKVVVIATEKEGKRKWEPYARVLWEQTYGKLPKGWVVIYLNGDGTDCRIENLYAIGPDVLALMARNRWFGKDPDVTLTAIKLCELARVSNGTIRV